jgi:hypothetical protein
VVVVMEAMTADGGEGQTTAENLTVDAENGVTYAYRRFGTPRQGADLPDAGHSFLFQWPVQFAEVVTTFLDA